MAVRILGVVKPGSRGASGGRSDGWLMSITLSPWRDPRGKLVDGKAVVWQPCEDAAALRRAREQAPADSALVEMEVTTPARIPGLEFRERAPHEFVLQAWAPVEDAKLERFARKIAPPVEVFDRVLGRFEFDPRLAWYTGQGIGSDGRLYSIRITPRNLRKPQRSIRRGRRLVERFERDLPAIRESIATRLYETWWEYWQRPGEGLSRMQLEARPVLESIGWEEESGTGTYCVWFGDDDLFGGHSIVVGLRGWEVFDAEIVG